jgi:hypothetical protein
MAVLNFSGFFYIENDPLGNIDNSFGYQDDISNNTAAAPVVTYEDILAKFASPLVLTRQNDVVNQKYIVDNFAYKGTVDDLNNIDTTKDRWDKLFNIANYIYHKAGTKTALEINDVLVGNTVDPDYLLSNFDGYKPGTVAITMRADAPAKLSKFSFQVSDGSGLQFRSVSMWANPETFVDEFTTATPYIYVYYTPDDSITKDEQQAVFNNLFNNIGREYVNNYRQIVVPLWSGDSGETQPFHIFSKAVDIPTDPIADITFVTVIRNTIRETEPSLTDDELIAKYPTIFIEGSRIIWPMFSNKTIGNYLVQDPQSGNMVSYMSNPVTLANINAEIAASAVLQGEGAQYEIFTMAHKWYPLIAFGTDGALTDKIPKFRPLLEDIEDLNAEDNFARSFNMYLTKVLNYITGETIISDSDKTSMGFMETSLYVAFRCRGIEWRVYKRGYQTDFDTQIG